jgi:hypothetical protein
LNLTGTETDDLTEIVLEYLKGRNDDWADLSSIKIRFEVYDSGVESEFVTLKGEVQQTIYQIIEKSKEEEFLTYLINKDLNHEVYLSILNNHNLTIEKVGDKYSLSPLTSKILEEEEKLVVDYLEKNASPRTINYVQKAKESFDNGDYYNTISNCRLALESLTKEGDFQKGLNELKSHGLIIEGDNRRKNEGIILSAMYGFNSTLGSHASSQRAMATFEQALFSMVTTKSTIRFILKKLEEAKEKNIILQEW